MTKKVSFLIINYNTKDLLEKCLNGLKGIYPNMEVIVVDNSSGDGSADMVRGNFDWVTLLSSPNNGLAYASNIALEKATGDYLLYLGTDAFPTPQAISRLVEYMDQNRLVGIITPKLVLRDGTADLHAHRGFPTPWASITYLTKLNKLFSRSKIFNRYYMGYQDMSIPHEIDLCIAHFMLVRREVFEKIGRWDERYFLYGEDVDFCYRTKQAGFKIIYHSNIEVLHYKGATVGIRRETKDISKASPETQKKARDESTKAMRLFYETHYEGKYPKPLTWVVLFGIDVLAWMRKMGLLLS